MKEERNDTNKGKNEETKKDILKKKNEVTFLFITSKTIFINLLPCIFLKYNK